MRAFHDFLWLSGFGLLLFDCAPVVTIADTVDSGRESGVSGEAGGAGTCSSNAECGATEICGFPESPACTAVGKCFAIPEAECLAYAAGCACDGSEINIACTGLPTGYCTQPLRNAGPCSDSGSTSDASPSDSGAPHCGTDSDCASGQHCAYLTTAACGAQGQCVDPPASIDASTYLIVACACDGTEVWLAPGGNSIVPAGYTEKPIAHEGACADGGLSDSGSRSCVVDADCGAGMVCGYAESSACSAQGQCYPAVIGVVSCPIDLGECACDGTSVRSGCTAGLPAGYAPKPVAYAGACTDAGPPTDAGGSDANPTSCVTDSDCGSGSYCGYLVTSACSARGQCLPGVPSNLVCGSSNAPYIPGCGCDGAEYDLNCTDLPAGYATRPIAYVGACTVPDGGQPTDAGYASDAGPRTCVVDSDCGSGRVCGYLESLACSAQGTCFPAPGGTCTAWVAGCACDGTEVNTLCSGLPAGYVSKPLRNTGPCTDDGGVICASNADCAFNELCGFPDGAGCSYRGRCFPSPGAVCTAYSPGCSCNGSEVNVACTGLPAGYEMAPLLHKGACIDGG